jgi:hypothetical protein
MQKETDDIGRLVILFPDLVRKVGRRNSFTSAGQDITYKKTKWLYPVKMTKAKWITKTRKYNPDRGSTSTERMRAMRQRLSAQAFSIAPGMTRVRIVDVSVVVLGCLLCIHCAVPLLVNRGFG